MALKSILARSIALLIAVTLAGCSTAPSLIRSIQIPAGQQVNFSDYGVLVYAESVKQSWGVRSLNSEVLALGGALSLAGLATAALATANSNVTPGLMAGANFLLLAMGIIKPGERNNALNTGAGLILDAEGEYVVNLMAHGYCTVPTDHLTSEGAILLQKTNAAVKATNSLLAGLLPSLDDMKALAPAPVDRAKLRGGIRGDNCRGVKP